MGESIPAASAAHDPEDPVAVATVFARDGFATGPRVLTDERADELAALVERIIGDPEHPAYDAVGRGDDQPFLFVDNLWRIEPAVAEVTADPTLLRFVAALLDLDSFRLFEDRLFYKAPGRSGARGWHRDTTYLPFRRPYRSVGCWVALADATAENGCMYMVPGSRDRLDLPDEFSTEISAAALARAGYETAPVAVPVRKGHVHFHDPDTLHASGPNVGADSRPALSIFYVEPTVRFDSTGRFASFFTGVDGEPLDPERHPLRSP